MGSAGGAPRDSIRTSYLSLVDASAMLRVVVGGNGRLLAVSRGVRSAVGLSREDAAALDFQALLSPRSAEEGVAALAAGLRARSSFVFEAELRTAGAHRPMLMTATPVELRSDIAGVRAFEGFLIKMQELENSRTYREALRARDAAERATAEKARLLAQISHEVRTPMNIIMGYIQLARGGEIGAAEARHLDTALSAAETLMAQMGDMLDLSKIEAGRLRLNIVEFDLGEELGRLGRQMQSRIETRGLEFILDIDPDIPDRMTGDPVRALQVVQNFLTNAVKFTDAGRIALRARLVKRGEDDCLVRLEVEDTGRGIPEALHAEIFTAFDRGGEEKTGTVEGWGLGLSICRAIAGVLGGAVGLRSTPGEGSTFHIDLTFGRPETPAIQDLDAPADAPGAAQGPRRKLSVLLAEDNQRNRFMLGEALHRMGHDVTFAADGAQAVSACAARPFDVVLMDIRMPRLRGDQATRAIRQDGANRDTPIIAVTANSRDDLGVAYKEAGFDSMMMKPVDLGALRALLDRVETLRPVARPDG